MPTNVSTWSPLEVGIAIAATVLVIYLVVRGS